MAAGTRIAIALIGVLSATAANAAVVYQERSRAQSYGRVPCDLSCQSEGGPGPWIPPTPNVSTTDFAPFTHEYSSYGLISELSYSLESDEIEFSALASAPPISDYAGLSSSYAAFSTTFVLTTTSRFSLSVDGSAGGGFGVSDLDVTFAVTGTDINLYRTLESGSGPAQFFNFLESGFLRPGTYVLSASAKHINSVAGPSTGSVFGTLTLQPVPLPAAAWLLGPGLIALARFRRRAQRAPV